MIKIYPIGCTCYGSSHDDFVGICSTEEKARAEIDRLNAQYLIETQQTEFPFGHPPFYFWEEVDYHATKMGNNMKYTVVYTVPSVGKFSISPKNSTAVEEYTLDVIGE